MHKFLMGVKERGIYHYIRTTVPVNKKRLHLQTINRGSEVNNECFKLYKSLD